jgi:NitT/TauT family transport system substrate-binding protein
MRLGRPRPRRLFAAGIGLAIVTSLAAACGGGTTNTANSGAGGGPEKKHIVVRVLPVADVAPVYIAKQRGYFADEGLDVEFKVIPTAPPAIAEMQAGKIDIMFGNYTSFFLSQAKGLKFRYVADGYQAKPKVFLVLTPPNSPIKKVSDLKGKKIGMIAIKNISELTADSTLAANGVDPKTVTMVQVPNEQQVAAAKTGKVDAVFMIEPFLSQAQQTDGFVTLFDAAAGQTADIPIGGWASTSAWAQKNPKTVAAFQRAMTRAATDAADRQLLEQVVPTYTKIDAKTASIITFGAYPTTLNKTRLQRVVDLMKTYNLLTAEEAAKVNLTDMLG